MEKFEILFAQVVVDSYGVAAPTVIKACARALFLFLVIN